MKPNLWDEINRAYTAQLIMTPLIAVTCWEIGSNRDASINSDGRLKYDVIPVTDEGKIIGFMTKDKPFKSQAIAKGWFVTRDTPISDLINILAETEKPAFFVFYRDEIVGIITPADLNKLPARIYIYSFIGDVELMLSELIRHETSISRDDILNNIGHKRSSEILKNLDALRNQNVAIEIIQLLYLSDMLTIIQKSPALREQLGFSSRGKAEEGLSGINELRNETMHLVKPVLSMMPDDLLSLQRRLARIQSILTMRQNGNSIL
jgi:CBS domain